MFVRKRRHGKWDHYCSSDEWSDLRSVIMQFYIMTLFPDMVMDGLNTSIIGRAMEKDFWI